jgi:hypothetical protein
MTVVVCVEELLATRPLKVIREILLQIFASAILLISFRAIPRQGVNVACSYQSFHKRLLSIDAI